MDIGAPVDRAGAVIPSQAYSISELAEFLRFFLLHWENSNDHQIYSRQHFVADKLHGICGY